MPSHRTLLIISNLLQPAAIPPPSKLAAVGKTHRRTPNLILSTHLINVVANASRRVPTAQVLLGGNLGYQTPANAIKL
ncbi:hypothetical protein IG631_00132 [Alternaria alternata]|nr:hypothetical protein IG631_00132 [Alternaria alternata]